MQHQHTPWPRLPPVRLREAAAPNQEAARDGAPVRSLRTRRTDRGRRARHQAADAMEGWDAGLTTGVVQTAKLVISELVTHAVRHAGVDQVSLTGRLDEAALRIEVCDVCPVLPRPGLPDPYRESGRGLFLVAALTNRYGAEPTEIDKRCWAEIDVTTGIGVTTGLDPEIAFPFPLQRSC
ncbi:ATP-binding protein [Streptomyces sp. NPDC090499]|uniref:ATP-binding protein n=1 Tax=unclassified Streptomyces TaxID=2593676 RepID=UPI00380D7B34